MNLTDFLREESILLDFSARDKWDAIRKLIDVLLRKKYLNPQHSRTVFDALVAREKLASTGMGSGIALPHATKLNVIDQPLAAMGISPAGINFQSLDNQPAKLIVLVLLPLKSAQIHVRTLAAVAHMLNFEEVRQSLVQSRSSQEVIRIFKEEEQKQLLSR